MDAEEYLGKSFPDKPGGRLPAAEIRWEIRRNEVEGLYDRRGPARAWSRGRVDVLISDTEERDDSIWKARRRVPGGHQGLHYLYG